MSFPKDFIWGAATAAYQIEGVAQDDGRGECIWTRFSHIHGNVDNGDTGDVACDHYHRYPEDIQLMRDLGLDAYRFSISWPRVIPAGTGATNPAGLDFYDRLVDSLLEVNITPYATVYHWDLPQKLQDRGGWANPDSPKWFADYTRLMGERLGDRLKHWITHNEPWVVAFVGNLQGRHAPGLKDWKTALSVAHHLLISHGEAVNVLRETVPDSIVGITLNLNPIYPASDSEEDKQAARRFDGHHNRWFLDPIFHGAYPADTVELLHEKLSHIDLNEVRAAKVDIDFLGINNYFRSVVANVPMNPPVYVEEVKPEGAVYTAMNWEVYPPGLTKLLLRVHEDYAPKAIYITENGSAWDDPEPENGIIHDPQRVSYLESHLAAVDDAIVAGAPVKGYFVWSLMDNFEWGYGYSKRFGIIYVDYATQERILKASGKYYRDHIAQWRSTH